MLLKGKLWQLVEQQISNPEIVEIVEEAYERCGLELRSGYDLKTARRSLDIMAAEWSNKGINLWTVESAQFH